MARSAKSAITERSRLATSHRPWRASFRKCNKQFWSSRAPSPKRLMSTRGTPKWTRQLLSWRCDRLTASCPTKDLSRVCKVDLQIGNTKKLLAKKTRAVPYHSHQSSRPSVTKINKYKTKNKSGKAKALTKEWWILWVVIWMLKGTKESISSTEQIHWKLLVMRVCHLLRPQEITYT